MMKQTVFLGALVFMLGNIGNAGGQEFNGHSHPPEHAGLHSEFYKNWKRPDNRKLGCCGDFDCAPALDPERRADGSVWVKSPHTREMIEVPPERIEPYAESPDHQAHVCIRAGATYQEGYGGGPFGGMQTSPVTTEDEVLCFTWGMGV